MCNFPSLLWLNVKCSISNFICQSGYNIIEFAPIGKIVISISEIVMHLVSICQKLKLFSKKFTRFDEIIVISSMLVAKKSAKASSASTKWKITFFIKLI